MDERQCERLYAIIGDPHDAIGELLADFALKLMQKNLEAQQKAWKTVFRLAEAEEGKHDLRVDFINGCILVHEFLPEDEDGDG